MLAITQPVDASLLHSVCALVGGDRGGAAAGWKTPPMGNEFEPRASGLLSIRYYLVRYRYVWVVAS
jgi:hypothetical protein